jgi:Tat protein secretion system quality control protein TatD with DNase activity
MNSFDVDADEVIQKTLKKGVMINVVGTQYETSRQAVEMAQKYEGIFARVDTHLTHIPL